jgi:hypothetical protein
VQDGLGHNHDINFYEVLFLLANKFYAIPDQITALRNKDRKTDHNSFKKLKFIRRKIGENRRKSRS